MSQTVLHRGARYRASLTALLPPPMTQTVLFRKKKPSHRAHQLTPRPVRAASPGMFSFLGADQGFPEEGLAPGPDFLCIPPEEKPVRLRGEHRHPRFLGHLEHPACQLRPSGLTGKPRVVSDPVRQQQLATRSGSLQQQSLEPRPSAVEPGAEPRRTAADDQNVVNIQKNPRLSLVVFQGKAGICASLTGGAYSCEASSTRAFASRRVTWAQRWAARVSKVG